MEFEKLKKQHKLPQSKILEYKDIQKKAQENYEAAKKLNPQTPKPKDATKFDDYQNKMQRIEEMIREERSKETKKWQDDRKEKEDINKVFDNEKFTYLFGRDIGLYGKQWASAYAHKCNLSDSEEKENLEKHIKHQYSLPSPGDIYQGLARFF